MQKVAQVEHMSYDHLTPIDIEAALDLCYAIVQVMFGITDCVVM